MGEYLPPKFIYAVYVFTQAVNNLAGVQVKNWMSNCISQVIYFSKGLFVKGALNCITGNLYELYNRSK